ncbi:MAG: rane protein [Gammaproteobacteria bacterium]|nr:rane protein [Gammaproteobacteria bacterium]
MKKHLFKSTLVVSACTGLSRVFGLVRDVVFASLFGAGPGMDAFIVAFRIPNFLRRLFAEGGFSQAFIPILAEYKEQRDKAAVQALLDQTTASLGLTLLITTIVGMIIAPVVVSVFALGWVYDADQQKFDLAVEMLRITFPYLLFISLTGLAGGILNTYRQFAVPAFTPVILNIVMIACALWLAPGFPEEKRIVALAWGVFIAGVMQLVFQLPFLLRLGLLPVPRRHADRAGVRRIFKLLIPVLFAVSVTQINLLVDTLIASFLVTGSISWLYYSDRLVEFPLGVFGLALATVILPGLSAHHSNAAQEDYVKTLDWALRWVVVVALPAAFGLALLARPILTTLFQYREFSAYDVEMASFSLMAFAAGLPAFILIKVLATGFFARQDTATPVKIGVIAMLSNIVLNLLLMGPLLHAGLALATSLSAYLNAGLLYYRLRQLQHYQPQTGWGGYCLKLGAALVVMTIVLLRYLPAPELWNEWGLLTRAWQLLFWVSAGAVVYWLVILIAGIRLREMMVHP